MNTSTGTERRACLSKSRFHTRSYAVKVARIKGPELSTRFAVYRCLHCGGYHLYTRTSS